MGNFISTFSKLLLWINLIRFRRKSRIGKKSKFYSSSSIKNFQNKKEKIVIGNNSHIRGELLIFKYGGRIEIGNNCFLGENSRIWSGENIQIGNNVLISHNVNIIDTNSHNISANSRIQEFESLIKNGHSEDLNGIKTRPIIIKDNVWLSFNVSILKGVVIGENSIIGAGCIITKHIPPNTLVTCRNNLNFKKIYD